MPIRVEFQGQLHEFPDGTPDDAIAAALQAEAAPAQPEPESAVKRFASGAWDMVNPVNIVTGIASAVTSPVDTVKGLVGAQVDQARKAADRAREGRWSEAVGHGAAAALPVLGPMAADIGEQIGGGDVAGGLGRATGLAIPGVALRGAQAGRARYGARVADSQTKIALDQIARVMAPDVGANKVRFGKMAESAAPDVAQMIKVEGAPLTRKGLGEMVERRYAQARAGLDDAADARLGARTVDLGAVRQGLSDKLAALTSEAVDGSLPKRTPYVVDDRPLKEAASVAGRQWDSYNLPLARSWDARPPVVLKPSPIGKSVIPAPNQPRAAMIEQALKELDELGPVSRYEPLRRMRQAYDGPASAVYNKALTPDFMKAMGSKYGAADVTDVLREQLAKMDPATDAANRTYAQWRKANDAMGAIEETERVRPTVGRKIMSRGVGALFGGAFGGGFGAAAGALAAPAVEQSLAHITLAMKTARGRLLLADLLRKRGADPAVLKSLLPAMAASHGQER